MVQPTNKRLVTESSVGGHVLTHITSPGATKDALGAEIGTQIATPGTPAAAALSATYAGRGDSFLSTAHALNEGTNSFGISATGDSTTVQDTGWFRLLADEVAAEFPAFHHRYRKWNDTTQTFDAPIALTPEGTKRGVQIAATGVGSEISGPNITGDIEIDVNLTHPSWASGVTQVVAHKWTNDSQRSWIFYLTSTGNPRFEWYTDGVTSGGNKISTAAVPFANGTNGWIRVAFDVDNGAGGHDVKFYTSTDGVTWTQLGTTITTAGATSVFAGTSQYSWGYRGGARLSGNTIIHEIRIKNGLNGYAVVPILPELWNRTKVNAPTIVGKPVVEWIMGGKDGAGIGFDYVTTGYLVELNRARKMNLNVGQTVMFFNSSHNDGNLVGKAWYEKYTTWVNEASEEKPLATRIAITQNPRVGSLAANGADYGHRSRRYAMMDLARKGLGIDVIDTYQAFIDDGRPLTELVPDETHPSAAGYELEKTVIKAELDAAIKRVSGS